jgi:hypothetical protein
MYQQYQSIKLKRNLNSLTIKGMTGVILEVYDNDNFEVEFVKEDGSNHEFEGQFTFMVTSGDIEKE